MKKLLTALIVISGILSADAQQITLFGAVYSSQDSAALAAVHIINVTKQNATTSDEKGYFSLDVSPDDKLMFTSIGYKSYSLTIPAETKDVASVTVFLESVDYQIDTITVRPFPNKEDFRHAFMKLNLPEERNKIVLNIPEDIMSMKFDDDIANKVSAPNEVQLMNGNASGLLSLLFGKMDPAVKVETQKKRFEEHKYRMAEIEKKYSNEFIEKLTGLKGLEAIVAFRKFCNLPNDFIIENDQYIIAEAIMDCYKEFEKMN